VLVNGVTASTRTWWRVGPWFAENGWRAVAVDLRRGITKEFNAGHGVHRGDFEGYVRLLAGWLGEPGA
jgi:alpha-beta hydrolase superfamily lysophospholipase